jgi:type II secretory ATPase GspE/PulE/Tfp pilus assembly ATPase PilB-like protein
MFATCMDDGMRTLKQDGIEKVLQGITDIQQVRAVCIK